MAAPKGNEFWKMRTKHGRDAIFSAPEVMLEACQEYFQWVEDNPLKEQKVFNGKDGIVYGEVNKMRAMTIAGLCIFLGIDQTTWREYGNKQDFSSVVTHVEQVIRSQKFAGAAADLLNANIIARDLGLSDRQEVTGKDGEKLIPETVSDKQLALGVLAMLRGAMETADGEDDAE